jgi:hypothetical protein
MLLTGKKDSRLPSYQDIRQFSPLILIMVDHESDLGILPDVANSLELARLCAFRLFVNGRIKAAAIKDKADWHDVRLGSRVSRGKVGHSGGADKRQMFLRERH